MGLDFGGLSKQACMYIATNLPVETLFATIGGGGSGTVNSVVALKPPQAEAACNSTNNGYNEIYMDLN